MLDCRILHQIPQGFWGPNPPVVSTNPPLEIPAYGPESYVNRKKERKEKIKHLISNIDERSQPSVCIYLEIYLLRILVLKPTKLLFEQFITLEGIKNDQRLILCRKK